MFFLAFLSIDEEVTSCSSRNEGKGPPEPEFTGDLRGAPNQGRHPRPLGIGAQQKVFKKRRRRPQTHPELENEKKNFLNKNASTKQPFHMDRRRMNFVKKFRDFLLILISSSLLRVLFSF